MIDTVFINGTVGAGKSTVAEALGEHETQHGRPHAIVDLDDIRRSWPAPPDDPFNVALELENLTAMSRVFRRAGAKHLIIAGVIERVADVAEYERACASDGLLVCRLVADEETLRARLKQRHASEPEKLSWYLHRVGELAGILEREDLDDVVLDSTSPPAELAAQIALSAGWD